MSDSPLPPKKDVARALLLRGSLFVHLDPRVEGVRVPAWLCDQPQLVLQVGLDMPIPIPDLRVDDEGVFGTLSFQRSPFTCQVPWEAVFAVVGDDGRGMVWPESMPPEIAAEVEREVVRRGPAEGDAGDVAPRKGGPPRLAVAPALPDDEPSRPDAEVTPLTAARDRRDKADGRDPRRPAGRPKRPLPPYLRVIK